MRGEIVELAAMLDVLCARAEQAEESAREALVALVDALNHEACGDVVQLQDAKTPYTVYEMNLAPVQMDAAEVRDAVTLASGMTLEQDGVVRLL